jgi:hypothetical protein
LAAPIVIGELVERDSIPLLECTARLLRTLKALN